MAHQLSQMPQFGPERLRQAESPEQVPQPSFVRCIHTQPTRLKTRPTTISDEIYAWDAYKREKHAAREI